MSDSESFPNGMSATLIRDETGMPTGLTYTKTTNCASDCDWYADQIVPTIHGQWGSQGSSLSSQIYAYDAAGRIQNVDDTPTTPGLGTDQCTRRSYSYDLDSNRTALTTWNPDPSTGACNSTGTGVVNTSTYDPADRILDSGYSLDTLGRVQTVPAADTGAASLSATYFEDDRIRTLASGSSMETFTNDAMDRVRQVSDGAVVKTWHYAGDNDSPQWVSENVAGTAWTRSVNGPGGDLVAVVDQAGVVVLQLANLHGDVVATASSSPTATSLLSAADQTEFGVPRSQQSGRYGWLGSHQRTTTQEAGTVLMGARVYLPTIGRFLQVDPVFGGSANSYDYANQDALGQYDLSGEDIPNPWGCIPTIDKIHESRSRKVGPGFISVHTHIKCLSGTPPASAHWAIFATMWRSQWYGWQYLGLWTSTCNPKQNATCGRRVMTGYIVWKCPDGVTRNNYKVRNDAYLRAGGLTYYNFKEKSSGPWWGLGNVLCDHIGFTR